MRNPASDPFALGGDANLSAEEIASAAPAAGQAAENARMIIQTVFGKHAEIKEVMNRATSGIEVETSLVGDFIVVEVNLQTPRGELLPCLTFLNRDEASAAFDLGRPDDPADWSEQIEKLQSPADLLVEALNAHLAAGEASGVSFARPSLRSVSLPDDAASLLLAPEEPLLELTYVLDIQDVGDLAVTTITSLDLVRRLGDDAGMPTGAGAVAPGGALSPEQLLDQGSDLFGAPTGRTAADILGTPAPAGHAGGTPMTPASVSGPSGGVVSAVQFQQFDADADKETQANIELIMDVNLRISVQLGRATMSIREVLDLGPGFVIELDKLAGEPVDILVNEKPIARGEVVVVDENFGVRVVDIVTPAKRVASLR